MGIRQRIEKLEAALGGKSQLHFVAVAVRDGESKEAALERTLNDAGIEIGDVGCIWYFGTHLFEEEDRGGYANAEDLVDYKQFRDAVLKGSDSNWRNSGRTIIKKRREMEAAGRLEEFYREMPLMRPLSG